MSSKVYHENLLPQILSEFLTRCIENNPTIDLLKMERNIDILKKSIEELTPKNYNRIGKIPSMKDGLFLKLNITDKSNFIDKDINIYFNGVITILQDGDVTKHYDIYAEIIIPKTFIMQQGRKTPVIIACTEDTYTVFKAFITRIVTYNGEYYIQFQFPYITDQIDEAQDIDIRVYVENDQLTLDLPSDPSAVSVESVCKEVPFGATPNHDPITNADKIVRSDIVRYLTISDTDHIIEDLEKTDPQHLIFRKENYPTDPTLPPDQQPTPNMTTLTIKYNDSIIWTKDYEVNSEVNEDEIVLSPLEGYTLEGIYDKPLTDDSKEKITYPIIMDQSKVFYANYIAANVIRYRRAAMSVNDMTPMSLSLEPDFYEFYTKDEFLQAFSELSKKYNLDLKHITFSLHFNDFSYLFKGIYLQSFPKIIVNSNYLDCTNMCEDMILFDSTNFKDFIDQIQSLDNVIYNETFKFLKLYDNPKYAGILKNPIRIVFKNKYNEVIKTIIHNKAETLNLCSYIQHEKYESAFLDIEMTQLIAKPISLSVFHPDELTFYLKEYDKPPYFINTPSDLAELQEKLLDDKFQIQDEVLVFSPNFDSPFILKTHNLPKSVYFMANKITSETSHHLINWCFLTGGLKAFDTYFNMIYDITELNLFASCIDEKPALLDFILAPVQNIIQLRNTFGLNIKVLHALGTFNNLQAVKNIFRCIEFPEILDGCQQLTDIDGLFYNLYDPSVDYITYHKIKHIPVKADSIIYKVDVDASENISPFKLEEFDHVLLLGDLIKLYNLIHPDTLNNPQFRWNNQKYKFTFKAYNFNFNVNGFLEVEFTKELTMHELIMLVHTKELHLPEIPSNVTFLSKDFDNDINKMFNEFTIICKK